MNLLPWRLIKLSVIFPLRDINLTVGEERGGVGRKLTHSVSLSPCPCLPQETATSNVALPAWLGWARPKSIWVWSKHICLVVTNNAHCWEAAAGRTTCPLQPFNMPCVIFFPSTAVRQVLFFPHLTSIQVHICI